MVVECALDENLDDSVINKANNIAIWMTSALHHGRWSSCNLLPFLDSRNNAFDVSLRAQNFLGVELFHKSVVCADFLHARRLIYSSSMVETRERQ